VRALAAARELKVAWLVDLAEILVGEVAIDDGRASKVEAMLRDGARGAGRPDAAADENTIDLVRGSAAMSRACEGRHFSALSSRRRIHP
jgi:hypothetical protein